MAKRKLQRRPDTAGRKRGGSSSKGAPTAPRGGKRAAGGRRGQPGRQAAPDTPPVVGFVSLGCAKNLVDSEKMLGQIVESGALITGDESVADTIVVNTCGFLEASRQEALDVIRELVARKQDGSLQRVVVAGCLVQRDGRDLLAEVPGIDALVGVHNRDDVAGAVWGARACGVVASEARGDVAAVQGGVALPTLGAAKTPRGTARTTGPALFLGDYHAQPWTDQGRVRLTPRHYAYVRISEGCDQKCTFCTIPSIRGPMHCKTPEALVAECRELIADRSQELILIGQDTTSYGRDIGYAPGLVGLLRTLDSQCDGARWIRLMYVYPTDVTDAMIDAIAQSQRIVNYIDIPLQHISDRMLRAMGRRVTRAQQETLLAKLRRRIPGVTIRTTFIVGFPGETDADFQELVDFVGTSDFDAVGAFRYSDEAETPSAKIPGHLPDAVKQERYARLMEAQQAVAFAAAQRRVGQTFDVLVDGHDAEGRIVARHSGQAPEVDSVCRLPDGDFAPGDWVRVKCTTTEGYDLVVQPSRRRLPVA